MGRVPENPTQGFFTYPNPTWTQKKNYKPEKTQKSKILLT